MAKKRKVSSQNVDGRRDGRNRDQSSKLTINTYEDAADSEDEFFINRDKILLDEGPEQKRRRKLEEDGALLEPSDEEVLPEPSSASTSDSEELQNDGKFSPRVIPPRVNSQSLDYASDASDGAAREEEDQDSFDWGTSRKDYYNADPITTETDALEEEAEARRLQKKQLQGMTEADFGLDEIDWAQAKKEWTADGEDGGNGKVISEVLPKLEITDSMGPDEKMQILRMRYPEFEPLAKEYVDLQGVYEDLSLASRAASAVNSSSLTVANAGGSTIAAVKLNALGGYLAALCMYFALLSATDTNLNDAREPMPPAELHDHKIMDTLVRCRQLWAKVKDMAIPEPQPLQTNAINGHHTSQTGEDADMNNNVPIDPAPEPRKRKSRSEKKAARALAAAQAEAEARRVERLRRTEESLKDLSELTPLTSHPKVNAPTATTTAANASTIDDNDSDLGDPTTLTPYEAARKAAWKKSLRFYTSQIAQKSNKRGAAGRDAGGDADIPHRERIRDRQARLNAEAESRGRKKDSGAGAVLNQNDEGVESGSEAAAAEQTAIAREVRGDQDDDYYDLVTSHAQNKKLLKTANAQAARGGGVVRILDPEGGEGADGKRGITYAIEKNKGLAPKRRKDVRNPRVKKRKKFEDKKKKLGSVRAVYKGGEGRGGYKGEMTGIKGGLVRSVKL
ncbi:MAG: hypothetical protein LQ343_002088 [Gyalolechia ehrenbergii]|nr:MAG: hypothetical protein LQ343_002088 [Gyalolechia ehrenbergii]